MQSGARICPRCATRVDERRARTSPFCLTCGAPLGAASSGAKGASGGRSPMVWVVLGLGGLLLFATCGAGVVAIVVSSSEPKGPSFGPLTTSEPKLESTTPPPPTVGPKPRPTVTPTVASPRPTVPTASTTAVPPPPVDAGVALAPFPRARANSEVDRVNAQVQTCTRTGDPTGSGTVKVDFEPDGRTTVTMRLPFASTPTGACISSRFAAIRLGKFEGPRESLERTFRINPRT